MSIRRLSPLFALLALGCEDTASSLQCGAGTVLGGDECLPEPVPDAPPLDCPTGSHVEGGSCVVDRMRYEIRIAETSIGANGHTKRKVLALGTLADGSPSLEPVIVSVDRATAGAISTSTLTLGPRGAETYFTPCHHMTAGCLGTAKVQLALASAPMTVIADVDIDLAVPTIVSTLAPCSNGDNGMYLDGNGAIRDSVLHVTEATWMRETYPDPPNEVTIRVGPADPLQGSGWLLAFDTIQLGMPLGVRTYTNAERYHFATAGHPGMSISGNSSACNTVSGSYQVHAFDATTVTISFEMHCDANPANLLEGCVHVGP